MGKKGKKSINPISYHFNRGITTRKRVTYEDFCIMQIIMLLKLKVEHFQNGFSKIKNNYKPYVLILFLAFIFVTVFIEATWLTLVDSFNMVDSNAAN